MTEEEIRLSLKKWILNRANAQSRQLDDDAPILEEGLLSSLDVVEFVFYIESLIGDEVDVDNIEPDAFQSIDALYATFFAES